MTPLQLINAYAALANGGTLYQPQIVREIIGPDGKVVRPFEPKVLHEMKVRPSVLRIMRNAARETVTLRHTYNLVDLPIKVAGKSGTAEFGVPDSQGPPAVLARSSSGFTPKDPSRTARSSKRRLASSSSWPSPTTRGPIGNAATEIVKYFLQLHYGIKKDYRTAELLKRGNFYEND